MALKNLFRLKLKLLFENLNKGKCEKVQVLFQFGLAYLISSNKGNIRQSNGMILLDGLNVCKGKVTVKFDGVWLDNFRNAPSEFYVLLQKLMFKFHSIRNLSIYSN